MPFWCKLELARRVPGGSGGRVPTEPPAESLQRRDSSGLTRRYILSTGAGRQAKDADPARSCVIIGHTLSDS